ncbi:hypothetical protein JCM16161A_11440 [Vulcanisaeta sp. JCM 16161]
MTKPANRFNRGQARIIEAIAATIIVLMLAALLPIIFNSPTTTLRSQVQTNTEWYAYDVLLTAINNPQFTYYVQHGNWSAIRSLLNTIVGPQYDWYIAVVPYREIVVLTSIVNRGRYVLVPLSIIPSIYYAPPLGMPIFVTSTSASMLSLNIYAINSLLGSSYSINTSVPLSNVAFIQCKNPLETNITQCLESGNVRMLSWWLEYFDPRTGVAVVWLNATGNVYMLVSNGSTPFNVLSNSYCQYPYCYPIGGVSNIMYSSFNAPYNNEPQFINYYTQQSLSQCYSSSNGMYSGTNYLVKIKTSGGTASGQSLNSPTTASCTLPVPAGISNNNVVGINAYLIGQLLTSIPGTNFTFGFGNVEVELNVCFINGTCINDYSGTMAGASFPISIGNVDVIETYGNTHEYLTLSVNGNINTTKLPSYYYVYLLTLSLSLNPAKCGVDMNASIYDLVTMSGVSQSYFYNLTSNNGLNCTQLTTDPNITSVSLTMVPSNLLIQQSTPQNPNNGVYYVYNATTIIYDLWITPTPTTSYYMPITTSYNFELLNRYNVVPLQYRERFFLGAFAPTASAYAIIQLPNGTYYLVYLGLMSVTGG